LPVQKEVVLQLLWIFEHLLAHLFDHDFAN
jgi:hypothetical protein